MESLKEIWNRYRNGKATVEDKKELIQAIDNNDAELDEIFSNDLDAIKEFKIDQDEINRAKKKLLTELGLTKKRKTNSIRLKVAASLVLFLGISLFLYWANKDNIVKIEVASGEEIEQVVLPDGSMVWLNNGSEISYEKDFLSSSTRKVTLLGNAFFDVERDTLKPFVIETGKLNIKVLGTSFDVYCYENEPSRVTVKTGKVEVSHTNSGTEVQLAKNEQSMFSVPSGKLQKIRANPDISIAWLNNELQFENMELGQALKRVERKYGVKINCMDTLLLKSRIRASYKNEPLDTILSDLAFMINFDYTKNVKTNEITLKPKLYEKIE